jgi:hypothetical protein
MTREMATRGKDVAAALARRLSLTIVHHEAVEHDIAEKPGLLLRVGYHRAAGRPKAESTRKAQLGLPPKPLLAPVKMGRARTNNKH